MSSALDLDKFPSHDRGGEQQLINFSIGLALSDLATMRTGTTSSFLILDEPFENLSKSNAELIINYINEHMLKKKESIFLISHEDSFKNLIPNKIHVEKRKGISYIV